MKDRKKRKEQLHDRKSLAAQQRMKSIATLASDAPAGKRKRKRNNGKCIISFPCLRNGTPYRTADDTFGANDEDWAVYREIVRFHRLQW
jgi:actin-related protein 5